MICDITGENCDELVVTEKYCMFCLMKKMYKMMKEANNIVAQTAETERS